MPTDPAIAPFASTTAPPDHAASADGAVPTHGAVQANMHWRRLPGHHPLAVDLLLVAVLDLITAAPLIHQGEHRWWVWLLHQAVIVPLAVRRRWPSSVFALLAVVALAQWAVGVRLVADAALLVALFTVAALQSRRRAIAAGVVLEIGVLLASVRFAPAGGGIIGSIVFLTGLVTAAFFLGTTVQTRRAYLAALIDRTARLEREREHQSRLATTAERTRIAREMHDIVAHSLSVVITLADGAALANQNDPAAASAAMRQVASTGREALGEMRRLLGVLRSDDDLADRTPQPGLDQLEDLLTHIRDTGLPVRFSVTGAPRPLRAIAQTTVYRVVQEALTNVLKHAAEPSAVDVALGWHDRQLSIDVVDNGRPTATDPPDSPDSPAISGLAGHGLLGMRERLALFAGTLSAGTRAGDGWHVHAELPFDGEDRP